jgi:hypothetical protein
MSDNDSNDIEQKVGWYNRQCRGEDCDEKMEDMSWRVYCNDCFCTRSDHADRQADDTEHAERILREASGNRSVETGSERGGD